MGEPEWPLFWASVTGDTLGCPSLALCSHLKFNKIQLPGVGGKNAKMVALCL